jgi:predicted nucleic acid-binding protein
MPVIANTSVISNFATVERLELLHTLWDKLYISEQVFEEIQAGFLQGYAFYADINKLIFPFSDTGWLHLTALNTSEEFQLFGQLLSTLHHGEASCLSIAYHRHWTFLSDDKAARKAGLEMSPYQVH